MMILCSFLYFCRARERRERSGICSHKLMIVETIKCVRTVQYPPSAMQQAILMRSHRHFAHCVRLHIPHCKLAWSPFVHAKLQLAICQRANASHFLVKNAILPRRTRSHDRVRKILVKCFRKTRDST